MNPPFDTARLVQLCAEAGWPATVRESGLAMVEIDAGHSRYHARGEAAGDGGLRAIVDLCDVSGCSSVCRSAIETLLRATSAAVHQVDHIAPVDADWAGLTTVCAAAVDPEALDHALSALAVACRMAGRETHALQHETLALEYLAWRAPASPDEPVEVAASTHSIEEHTCLQQP
jgi:hypothetical protein